MADPAVNELPIFADKSVAISGKTTGGLLILGSSMMFLMVGMQRFGGG